MYTSAYLHLLCSKNEQRTTPWPFYDSPNIIRLPQDLRSFLLCLKPKMQIQTKIRCFLPNCQGTLSVCFAFVVLYFHRRSVFDTGGFAFEIRTPINHNWKVNSYNLLRKKFGHVGQKLEMFMPTDVVRN